MKRYTAYLSLGSNIEPKLSYLSQAIELLDQDPAVQVTQQSQVYDTAPVGYLDQDNFLNMVIELETDLESESLLDLCQSIEQDLHRVREFKNGPRTIDLDIIVFSDFILDTDRLQVPHPRMQDRAFVLFPLAEIAPDLLVPELNQTASQLRDVLPDQDQADVKALGALQDLQ